MDLLIASKNLHKIREIRDILSDLSGIDLFSLVQFPDYQPLPETGKTFEENAIQKAVHAAQTLGKWVLADDSGLVVPALEGRPGIFSRRYAGENASDLDNRKKLLADMQHLKNQQERSAFFTAALALASPKGLVKSVSASCEGVIIDKEKGRHGFGYDSIFLKNDYDRTFAELDAATKNRVSHRRRALEKMRLYIERLLQTSSTGAL